MRIHYFAIIIIFISCASGKRDNSSSESEIIFGTYGGFAGSYDEFTLHVNGEVTYKNSLKADPVRIKDIKHQVARQLFHNVNELELYKLVINDPGNLTYFLKFDYSGQMQELKWGGNQLVPDHLKSYYRLLRSLTKDKNPVM
jgi:hypothetical protein